MGGLLGFSLSLRQIRAFTGIAGCGCYEEHCERELQTRAACAEIIAYPPERRAAVLAKYWASPNHSALIV